MSPIENAFSLSQILSRERRRGARALLLALALSASSLNLALSQTNLPAAAPTANAATGPTIRLGPGGGQSPGNPIASFMYFVPLISPEPIASVTSPGNTQSAHVLSAKHKNTSHSFAVTCEFEFSGDGSQQSILDLGPTIRRQDQRLKAGRSSGLLLSMISVLGPGRGIIDIEGTITNNVETVSEVRLRFNAHGKTSPVSIDLCEIRYQEGEFRHCNEMVARVNTLTFNRKSGRPKMEVSVASVKKKSAGNGLWQNFKGSVVGLAVNLLIPPLTVEAVGHQAMLDFGQALASGAATFTFPCATNLN
jgi:hypothetical protein